MRMEHQSASNCLKEKCPAVNMDKYRDCMPRDSKTMKSNQLLCGRGVPCKDEGLKREISLNPVLLIKNFVHEVYDDMP